MLRGRRVCRGKCEIRGDAASLSVYEQLAMLTSVSIYPGSRRRTARSGARGSSGCRNHSDRPEDAQITKFQELPRVFRQFHPNSGHFAHPRVSRRLKNLCDGPLSALRLADHDWIQCEKIRKDAHRADKLGNLHASRRETAYEHGEWVLQKSVMRLGGPARPTADAKGLWRPVAARRGPSRPAWTARTGVTVP